MKRKYVIGFMFSEDHEQVALFLEDGLLSGIGGYNDYSDSFPIMKEEFYNKTGYLYDDWLYFMITKENDKTMKCYMGIGDLSKIDVSKGTQIVYIKDLMSLNLVKNMDWLMLKARSYV